MATTPSLRNLNQAKLAPAKVALTSRVRCGKSARRKGDFAARAFAVALSGVSCSAPRYPRPGSGPGRAGSSDNAALCPGQTIAAPGTWARALLPHALPPLQTCNCPLAPAPSPRLPRHIMGRYPTPPPARARCPPWSLAACCVIYLGPLRHRSGPRFPRRCVASSARHGMCKKQHIPGESRYLSLNCSC